MTEGVRVLIRRMPGTGGVAQKLSAQQLKDAVRRQIFPQVLPGAKAVLFNSANTAPYSLETLDIEAMQLVTGQRKTLVHGGYWPRCLATSGETGHLVYMHEGTLFGVGFDPGSLELLGTATPLLDDVSASAALDGGGQLAFSNTGTFVYLSGHAENDPYPMLWLDAAGRTRP